MRGWLLAGVVLIGLGVATAYVAVQVYDQPGPMPQPLDVVVPRGSRADVALALGRSGIMDSRRLFEALALATAWQGPLRSAEFSFPAHASIGQILAVLRRGAQVQHLLTIPEGLTASRIGGLLGKAVGVTGEIAVPAEAAMLPETYAYVYGVRADALVSRGARAMGVAVDKAWASRSAGLPVKSPRALIVLASLVERETRLPAERRLVARVFLNRLRLGMRLQSDPTVIYGESGGDGELPAGLSREALERTSPYNTYEAPGLPAGPICAPGRASIEAVAHPATSEAVYFVADGAGGHVFADTLAEHTRNVARYRRLLH